MRCPHCLTGLKHIKGPPARIGCPRCGGRWHTFKVFAQKVGPQSFEELLQIAKQAEPKGKNCPHCEKRMHPLRTPENKAPLDVCFKCESVWFDFMEFESFKAKRNPLGEAFAKMHEQTQNVNLNGVQIDVAEVDFWAPLTDPRAYDEPLAETPRVRGFPFISYLVALILFLVFLKLRTHTGNYWAHYAFQVGVVNLANFKNIFASFFVNPLPSHVFAQIYVLFVIGACAEDVSSKWEYLFVLFGGHIVGTLLQGMVSEPGTLIAGSYAGVFSVLVYYSVLFPKARFQVTDFMRRHDYSTWLIRYSFPVQYLVVALVFVEIAELHFLGKVALGNLAHLGGCFIGVAMALGRKSKY